MLLFEDVIRDKIHLEMPQNWTDPDKIVFSGAPSLFLCLQLSQSLGTAGTCAEGQMGTDSPLHQDASIWPKKTDLTETGSKK